MKHGCHAIWFETIYTQAAPPFAVASLDRFDPALLLPTAGTDISGRIRWTQQQGEDRNTFLDRIRADLEQAGVSGESVFVYERGSAFERRFIPFSPDPQAWLAQFKPPPAPEKAAKVAA